MLLLLQKVRLKAKLYFSNKYMNKKINEKNHSSVKTGSVGNNGLLPHAKMLLVPMIFFLWWVDYAMEENVLTGQM